MSNPPTGLQVFPGQPVCNGPLPAFQRVLVNGDSFLIYATTTGIVFYTPLLDYVSTFPFPTGLSYEGTVSGDHKTDCFGFDADQDGSILLWKYRNAWIIRAEPRKARVSSKEDQEPPKWKLHSEICSQHSIHAAQLVKSSILLQLNHPTPSIEVWKLKAGLSLPVWERKAMLELKTPVVALALSPCQTHFAYCQPSEPVARVQPLNQQGQLGGPLQTLRHPGKEGIRAVYWRGQEVSWGASDSDPVDDSQPALFTFDTRNTLRLFSPVVDAPHHFQLVFNYRLSALNVPDSIDVRRRRQELLTAEHGLDQAYAPFSISSSGSGDEIYWMDRSHNVRSVRLEGFEAKPPSVLRVEGEKIWKVAQSSGDTMAVPVATQLIAVDVRNSCTLVAETDTSNQQTHLKRIELKIEGCRNSKQVFLGLSEEAGTPWREDRFERFITVNKQGVCGVWQTNGTSPPGLVGSLKLTINSKTVDAVCMITREGPLVYSSGTHIQAVDLETHMPLWGEDMSERYPDIGRMRSIRRLGDTDLLLISHEGKALRAFLEGSASSSPRFEAFDPLPAAPGAFRPISEQESCRIVQAAGPLVLDAQDLDIVTVATTEGRLLWIKIGPQGNTIERSLRIASETMDMLAVAGRRKAACVSDGELIIWDLEDATYANAAEHVEALPPDVLSLSWSLWGEHLLLAVGTPRNVRVLFQGRTDPDQLNTAWSTLFEIELSAFCPYPLSSFTTIPGGQVVMCAGTQILTAQPTAVNSETLSQGCTALPDFHRFQLEQCVVWNREEQIHNILLRLDKTLGGVSRYANLSPEEFWSADKHIDADESQGDGDDLLAQRKQNDISRGQTQDSVLNVREDRYPFLTNRNLGALGWSRKQVRGVDRMVTVLKVLDKETLRLDNFGKKYISALHMRASGPSRPSVPFRYVVWALHSRRQADLLRASTQYWEQDRLTWTEAKRMGTPFWLSDIEALRGHADQIARNEFLSSERDPISCSLLYFALDKKATVYGLWRQAYGHKEQQSMLKFLSNDFTEERWKGAALKNAYALLSKQRYQYAAAFFMLAGQPKDAIRICLRQLDDLEMAIMLARIADYKTEHPGDHAPTLLELDKQDEERPVPVCGEMLREVIETTILPNAQKAGDRWLSHWALWNLGQRATAIRHLTLPLRDVGMEPEDADNRIRGVLSGSADWMSLYYDLRRRYFETDTNATDSVAPLEPESWLTRTEEWDMVRHRSQRLWAMGFWSLSLAIIRDWKFVAMTMPSRHQTTGGDTATYGAETDRGKKQPDSEDDQSAASQNASTETPLQDGPQNPPTKLSLFKENAVVVDSKESQGAMEFDMSSFF